MQADHPGNFDQLGSAEQILGEIVLKALIAIAQFGASCFLFVSIFHSPWFQPYFSIFETLQKYNSTSKSPIQ
jgi:hypothetical protein